MSYVTRGLCFLVVVLFLFAVFVCFLVVVMFFFVCFFVFVGGFCVGDCCCGGCCRSCRSGRSYGFLLVLAVLVFVLVVVGG